MANSFIDAAKFKQLTGINLEQDIVCTAVEQTAETIVRDLFIPKEIVLQQQVEKFQMETPLADINMDGSLTTDDIEVFEIDSDFVKYDLSAKIESFQSEFGFVKFSETLPTVNNRTLYIRYYIGKFRYNKMKRSLIELNRLMAVNYLFRTVPYSKLQSGISSWNLNGVSVAFDLSSMKEIMATNTTMIDFLYNELTPFYSEKTKLGYDLDQIDRYVSASRTGSLNLPFGSKFQ